jgi:hypothetical protein
MIVWKYVLKITDRQVLVMPDGAEILSVASQHGNLCLWAIVDEYKDKKERYIEIVGTGNPLRVNPGFDRKFIGTAVVDPFVWHVFERLC